MKTVSINLENCYGISKLKTEVTFDKLDQPEDNLDNDSVANVLVNFIKKAKKKRQIIMVTHNPNLAVVADSEQIVYVNIDKKDNCKFSLESGSIESPNINKHIVDVLEEAMPVFRKRDDKYIKL